MKTIQLIILTIFLQVFFTNCPIEADELYRQYQIKNNSQFNLKLKFFNKYSIDKSFEIDLAKDSTFLGNLSYYRSDDVHLNDAKSSFPINGYKGCDSLIIIFANKRKTTKTVKVISATTFNYDYSSPIDRNPFRHGSYEKIGKDKYEFYITVQDYNNAEDCGGACE